MEKKAGEEEDGEMDFGAWSVGWQERKKKKNEDGEKKKRMKEEGVGTRVSEFHMNFRIYLSFVSTQNSSL